MDWHWFSLGCDKSDSTSLRFPLLRVGSDDAGLARQDMECVEPIEFGTFFSFSRYFLAAHLMSSSRGGVVAVSSEEVQWCFGVKWCSESGC